MTTAKLDAIQKDFAIQKSLKPLSAYMPYKAVCRPCRQEFMISRAGINIGDRPKTPSYCPFCSQQLTYEHGDGRDRYETLSERLGIPVELVRELHQAWDRNEEPSFIRFIRSLQPAKD